jgi:hypothetical protein
MLVELREGDDPGGRLSLPRGVSWRLKVWRAPVRAKNRMAGERKMPV